MQVKEARETITANLDARCIREFGEACSRVRFVGDTICLQWFEVGGKRFRLDEGDRVRLHKGNCSRCGTPLWSREFILSSTTAQHAANDNPVSHDCVIHETSTDLVKVGDEYLELLFFNYDRVNPIMRYKEILIVGGINDRSLRLCTGIVDQGGLPRFLIRKEEEERIPGRIRGRMSCDIWRRLDPGIHGNGGTRDVGYHVCSRSEFTRKRSNRSALGARCESMANQFEDIALNRLSNLLIYRSPWR